MEGLGRDVWYVILRWIPWYGADHKHNGYHCDLSSLYRTSQACRRAVIVCALPKIRTLMIKSVAMDMLFPRHRAAEFLFPLDRTTTEAALNLASNDGLFSLWLLLVAHTRNARTLSDLCGLHWNRERLLLSPLCEQVFSAQARSIEMTRSLWDFFRPLVHRLISSDATDGESATKKQRI